MKLRRIVLIFIMLYQTVSSIQCFYCLNCTLPTDTKILYQCQYKFTHCAAIHLTVQKRNASFFACGLSKTCTEHFTADAFDRINSCYICEQDYCNAYIDQPFSWN